MFRKACFLFFMIPFIGLSQSKSVVDSLHRELKKEHTFHESLDLLYYLSVEYSASNFDSALFYGKQVYEQAIQKEDYAYTIYGLSLMAYAHDYNFKPDSARYYYNQAMLLAKGKADSLQMGILNFNLGTLEVVQGRYAHSLAYFEQSIDFLRNQPGSELRLSRVYLNLAIAFSKMNQPDRALEMYYAIKPLREKNGDEKDIFSLYHNIASAHRQAQTYDSAFYYTDKALRIEQNINNEVYINQAKELLANLYWNTHQFKEAKKILEEVVQPKQAPVQQATTDIYLGAIYSAEGRYSLADKHFMNAFPQLSEEETPELLKEYFQQQALHQERKKDFAQALYFQKKFKEQADRLLNQQVVDKTTEWEVRLQNKEKENQIVAFKLEQEASVRREVQQKNERNIIISLAAIFLLMALSLFRIAHLRKRAAITLEGKNLALSKAIEERDLLMKEVHHRVKNNLQVITSLLNLQSRFIDDERANAALRDSKNRVNAMGLIHNKLYELQNLKEVEAEDYFRQLLSTIEKSYNNHSGTISVSTEIEPIYLDVDQMIPLGLIANELITNAFKHAFLPDTEGHILLQLYSEEGWVNFVIEDNGKGFTGTALPEKQKSLGTVLIRDLAKKLQAEVQVSGSHGTKIHLRFPSNTWRKQSA